VRYPTGKVWLAKNLAPAVKTAAVKSSCPNEVAYSSLRWDGGSKCEPPACADPDRDLFLIDRKEPHQDRAGGCSRLRVKSALEKQNDSIRGGGKRKTQRVGRKIGQEGK
jgi:hypothetical protein